MLSTITLIGAIALLLIIALDNERNRKARHRAQTRALLLNIQLMPHLQTVAPTFVAAGRR